MFNSYAYYYNLIYKGKPYNEEAKFILDKYGKPVKSIFEIGCGTGRHAIYWAKKGIKVTAIDSSKEMVDQALKHENITYYHMDATFGKSLVPTFGRRFNLAVAMFNVVGYTGLDILKDLPLRKGGIFMFDAWNPNLIHKFPGKVEIKWVTPEVIKISFADRSVSAENKIRVQLVVSQQSRLAVNEAHELFTYTYADVAEIAEKYGYTVKFTIAKGPGPVRRDGWTEWYALKKI